MEEEFIEAARQGNLDLIKTLGRLWRTNIYAQALREATSNGHLEVVKYLNKLSNNNEFEYAVINDDIDGVKAAIAKGVDTAEEDCGIHTAASHNYFDIVKLLVERGRFHNEAVEDAAANGNLEIVEFLLDADSRNLKYVNNALVCAAQTGHSNTVKRLIERGGVDIHYDDDNAFFLALEGIDNYTRNYEEVEEEVSEILIKKVEEFEEVIELLIDACVDSRKIKYLNCALVCAAQNGESKFVERLIERGADIHYNNDSAFKFAIKGEHVKVIKILIDAGANITDELIDETENENIKLILKQTRYRNVKAAKR